jgi:hypothetical protein
MSDEKPKHVNRHRIRDQLFFGDEGSVEEYQKKLVGQFADDVERLRLQSAKKCISLGTGNGVVEINITKALFPNIESFTLVIPDDEEHAKEVKEIFEKELPGVVITVLEMPLEEFFKGGDAGQVKNSYDVAFLTHYLYVVHQKSLYKTFFDDVLRPGGILIVEQNDDRRKEAFMRTLGGPENGHLFLNAHVYMKEIMRAGFLLQDQVVNDAHMIPRSEDAAVILGMCLDKTITMDELNQAFDKHYPKDHPEFNVNTMKLMLFHRPAKK